MKIITPENQDRLASASEAYRSGYGAELYDVLAEVGLVAGRAILDVGCGSGLSMEPLVARGCTLTGLDSAVEMLTLAKERLPDVKLVRGNAEKLPFQAHSFDGAICGQAFHKFDQPAAMAEMMRVVRPGRPVAIWWRLLSTTERVRQARDVASLRAARPPIPDVVKSGFRAFYAAPFADRRLRVLRHTVLTTVDRWMGYERTRVRTAAHYGPNLNLYLTELEKELRAAYGDGEMQVSYVIFLYVGLVP